MVKTLVTLGYHYNELPWGRIVRDTYLSRDLMQNRDITFYEITRSTVPDTDICVESLEEIKEVFVQQNFEFWIDIHCGHKESYHDRFFSSYIGFEREVLRRASRIMLPDLLVSNRESIPSEHRTDWFMRNSNVDPYFPEDALGKENNSYLLGLERTISFINQIYDVH